MVLTLVSADIGNANIKVKSAHGKTDFPHALFKMTRSQIEAFKESGESIPNIYVVNGEYYSIGEQAIRHGAGAAQYGASRYVPGYYGVLIAIGLFRTLPEPSRNVCLLGTHTPRDIVYKKDLIDAAQQVWTVQAAGRKQSFKVIQVLTMDEPSAHYRHATLSDGGQAYRGEERLRRGSCAIIDIGGLTTGLALAVDGKIDYSIAESQDRGVIGALRDLERSIRSRYRRELKQSRSLDPIRLRDALMDGEYPAGGLGVLECKTEADEACNLIVNDVAQFFEDFGGNEKHDTLLLAGGGSGVLRARLRKRIGHKYTYVTDEHPEMMFMGAAFGGFKTLQLMEARGKL